jgi:hypothetical protein
MSAGAFGSGGVCVWVDVQAVRVSNIKPDKINNRFIVRLLFKNGPEPFVQSNLRGSRNLESRTHERSLRSKVVNLDIGSKVSVFSRLELNNVGKVIVVGYY